MVKKIPCTKIMSEYLNHFLGYFFKLFKRDSRNKDNTLQRSNSVREICVTRKDNNMNSQNSSSLFRETLKRNKSCPAINTQSTGETQCLVTSLEKLNLRHSGGNTTSGNKSPTLEIFTLQGTGETQRFLISPDKLDRTNLVGNVSSGIKNPAIQIVNLPSIGESRHFKNPLNQLIIKDSFENTVSVNNSPAIDRSNSQSSGEAQHLTTFSDKLNIKTSIEKIAQGNNSPVRKITNLHGTDETLNFKSFLDKLNIRDSVGDTVPGCYGLTMQDDFLQGDRNISRNPILRQNLEFNSVHEKGDGIMPQNSSENFINTKFSPKIDDFSLQSGEGAIQNKWNNKYGDIEEIAHELQCSCSVCRNFRSTEQGELTRTNPEKGLDTSDLHNPAKNKDDDLWRNPFSEYPSVVSLHSSSESIERKTLLEEQQRRAFSKGNQKLKQDFKSHTIFTMTNPSYNNSAPKSKIPVPQGRKNICKNIFGSVQSSWKSRTNLFDWSRRNSRNPHKNKPKKSYSTTSIVERSVLSFKFDRMFRRFSKKIYRGNIIDRNSHSRWMRLAGILEEEDASSFKCYAQLKLVLTLSEYKEALSYMCKTQGMDYWDVLRMMTNVKLRGEVSSTGENDERDIESNEDLSLNVDYAR